MSTKVLYIGLDVHKETIAVSIAPQAVIALNGQWVGELQRVSGPGRGVGSRPWQAG